MIRVNERLGPEVRFRKFREHHQSNDQRYSHVDQRSGNRDANIALPGNLARDGRGDLMGSRRIALACSPSRRATNACPSSCAMTAPKMIPISASTRLGAGAVLLFMADSAIHTKPSRNTKVR